MYFCWKRPCILNVICVYLLLVYVIVVYVFLDAATLTEDFPCFFLSCKANARVNLAKTGTARTPTNCCVVLYIACFVSFCVLFLCKCVLYYCHRVTTQLQLINISYHIKHSVGFLGLWKEYIFIWTLQPCGQSVAMTEALSVQDCHWDSAVIPDVVIAALLVLNTRYSPLPPRMPFFRSQARSQNSEDQLLASSCLVSCPSLCPSAWNNLASTRRILMKFDIQPFFFFCKSKENFKLH